jgi:hypothetical protein
MTDFELEVLRKLDIIIAQTAPKQKRAPTKQGESANALEILRLFNLHFKKSVTMTALHSKCINARLRDGFSVKQIDEWLKYASSDPWWKDKTKTHKISTMLGEKLGDFMIGMGSDWDNDDKSTDEEWEM